MRYDEMPAPHTCQEAGPQIGALAERAPDVPCGWRGFGVCWLGFIV